MAKSIAGRVCSGCDIWFEWGHNTFAFYTLDSKIFYRCLLLLFYLSSSFTKSKKKKTKKKYRRRRDIWMVDNRVKGDH